MVLNLLFCLGNLSAKIQVNSLFSDHMVLQKGVNVSFWGTADANEKVTIQFNGQTAITFASNGKWKVNLSPMAYLFTPSDLLIFGKDSLVIHDVLVGEVWLCSGQSNMERQLGPRPPQPLITNWEEERDGANYPLIREYKVPMKYSAMEMEDANGNWQICSPSTVSEFSAVGYFFARELFEKMKVPIGILFSAYGGSPAEDWTSKEALKSNPELIAFVENYDSIINANWHPQGEIMSGLYNGMIHPLLPFSFKGVCWYQGESNNSRSEQYEIVLKNMIQNWRKDFKQKDLPFLIVQIAPHKDMRPELREAQLLVCNKDKYTALIVTTDCGDANDIHPPHKQAVGMRLALAARGLVYKEKIEFSGPVLKSAKFDKHQIVLTFKHAIRGLSTKNNEALRGFMVAGIDGKFLPAIATIKGNKIMVGNEEITKPKFVHFGWENVPDVNLINSNGLPASPFRLISSNFKSK